MVQRFFVEPLDVFLPGKIPGIVSGGFEGFLFCCNIAVSTEKIRCSTGKERTLILVRSGNMGFWSDKTGNVD